MPTTTDRPPDSRYLVFEMESHWAVGLRIRAIRERRGLTRAELARRIGRSARTLSAVERGRTLPGFDILRRLAAVLGVSIVDFFQPAGGGPHLIALHAQLHDAARALSVEDLELAVGIFRILANERGDTPEERPPPTKWELRRLILGEY
jgi:transcriptional regulator with XRE-family HTH domain